MKKIIILFIGIALSLLGIQQINAQEINAQVIIQTPQLRLTDPAVFQTLENDLRDFINTQRWTEETFNIDERLECTFLFTITEEVSPTQFKANLAIQSSRPVFNSAYSSVLFSHQDNNIEFQYQQFENLQFNENTYTSELTSIVAYYVYVLLGYDFDSFEKNGGTPYFTLAQTIINNAQASNFKGWQPFDNNRNRYWLIENLLDNRHRPLREAYYRYHRLGLDRMYENMNEARNNINNALKLAEQTHNNNTNSMAIDVFVVTKGTEVINIFSGSKVMPADKMKAINSMAKIDPANIQAYNKINDIVGGTKNSASSSMSQGIGGQRSMRPKQ